MNPTAIVKLFQTELGSIARRYGADVAMSIATQIDQRVDAKARQVPPGSTIAVDVDWNTLEAQLAGQAAATAKRVAQVEADQIVLSADGLAKIVAAARAESGKVTEFEYDNFGETGKITRIRQRPTR